MPRDVSPQQHRSSPNGAVLILEPTACRIQAIQSGKHLWSRDFPACAGLLEFAIARDSTTFVRAGPELAALDSRGRERWRIKLEGDRIPRAIAAPTTLADSRVVVAESPRTVMALDAEGHPVWRFSVPREEMLVAPPEGLMTEGLALLTGVASYLLGADGALRSRVMTTPK